MVGIINPGRLVREGPIKELLSGEGQVRARIAGTEVPAARTAVEQLAGDGTSSVVDEAGQTWLTVRIAPNRAAEVNRALVAAGVYASGLESGTDLESLFLELTGSGEQNGGRTLGGVA
jgi:ABC-2 type transport system ATP-binding protein